MPLISAGLYRARGSGCWGGLSSNPLRTPGRLCRFQFSPCEGARANTSLGPCQPLMAQLPPSCRVGVRKKR